MKLSITLPLAAVCLANALAVSPVWLQAQNTAAPSGPSAAPQGPSSRPNGTVLFSRSADEDGKVTTTVNPAATAAAPSLAAESAAPSLAAESAATDADRQAVVFQSLDLDVHLQTAAQEVAVRARVTVRNGSKTALKCIPLQISSSLHWEQIRVDGRNVSFSLAKLNSDTDHTGQLYEAAVPLATPLAPGASLALDATYSGPIEADAKRLSSIDTPDDVAPLLDWDEISPGFTGLRGFGNVVWYPVASVPALLRVGSRVFDEIGRHKLSLVHTQVRVRLTVEFPHDEPPTIALVNGTPVALSVAEPKSDEASGVSGVATASFETQANGFLAPSIFVAAEKAHPSRNVTAFTRPDNDISVESWMDEAAAVTPFVEGWLGHEPRTQLTLLDLPDPDDAPFETGALLVTNLRAAPTGRIDRALAHALAHAYTQSAANSAPPWLNEGLATFVESLWVEKRHGRDQALGMLETDRGALALAEPSSPGESAGTPLANAAAPVYYRTKAAYVFWMLRDLTGDDALGAALRNWVQEASGGEPSASLPDLLKQAGVRRDLAWFASDWMDADKGLPDLAIESVFPHAALAGTYLVAVNVRNTGYAAAEVPVTVRTANNSVTERLFVPARGTAVERVVVVGPPTQVQVNDGTVPETQASIHVTSSIGQSESSQLSSTSSLSGNSAPAPQ